MATERFPAFRIIRDLQSMRSEVDWWRASYQESAVVLHANSRGTRYEARDEVLDKFQAQIGEAIEVMRTLPRLS